MEARDYSVEKMMRGEKLTDELRNETMQVVLLHNQWLNNLKIGGTEAAMLERLEEETGLNRNSPLENLKAYF